MSIDIVVALLYACACLFFVVVHAQATAKLTLLDWSLMTMAGVYGIVWPLVLYVVATTPSFAWTRFFLPFEDSLALHTGAAALVTLGTVAGWSCLRSGVYQRLRGGLGSAFGTRRSVSSSGRADSSDDDIWTINASDGGSFLFFCLLFILGVSALLLYSKDYGGPIGLLRYSALIRSSLFNMFERSSMSYLRPVTGLCLVASYGLYGLLLSGYRSPRVYITFVLAFLSSVFVLYSELGRMNFVIFLCVFLISYGLHRRVRPYAMLATIFVLGFVMFLFAYFISNVLNLKGAENFVAFVAQESAPFFASLFAQMESGTDMRCFVDYLMTPLFVLPSSLWIDWVVTADDVNTIIIYGATKGEMGVTGGIPVDLISLGYLQLKFAGIPVAGLIYGMLLHFLDRFLQSITNVGLRRVFEAYLALRLGVLAAIYASPENIILGNFAVIAAFCVLAALKIGQWLFFKPVSA